jgi:hypothetical protein
VWLNVPNSRVRRIETNLPTQAIEANSLQGVEIDAFETARVNHVVRRVRARTIEGSDAAVAAEVVKCALGAELIRRKIGLPLDEAEPVRGDHVMEIAFAPTDGAVTLAETGKLGSNLKTDASAVARALVGLHLADGSHDSLLNAV